MNNLSVVFGRKLWLVIYGEAPPEGEIENAKAIAKNLGFGARAVSTKAMWLGFQARFCNLVIVGGPFANEWAVKMNDYVNPKYDITILREKTKEETWKDYIASGAVQCRGFLKDVAPYAGVAHKGMIGVGAQPYLRLRALQIFMVGGWDYGDTCTMGLAFREGQGAGIYDCIYTTPPSYTEPCQEITSYSKITDP